MAENEAMRPQHGAELKEVTAKDELGGYWLPSAVGLGKEALPLYHAELTRAISAYNLRRLDEAELILRKLLDELGPLMTAYTNKGDAASKDEAAAFHLLYAQVLTAQGRTCESREQENPQARRMYRAAETEFAVWIDRYSNPSAQVYCDYGVSLFKLGSRERKRAIQALETARDKNALNAEPYRYLGICYCQGNEPDKAKECFEKALAQETGDFLTRKALAECLESQGKIDEALAEYNHVALSLTTSRMFDHAKAVTSHMLALAPKNQTALVRAGETLLNAGLAAEALEMLEDALEHQPKNAVGIWLRGLALYNLERYQEAARQFQRALKLDPTLYKARIKRASALRHLKKFPAALEALDEALAERPGDSEAITEKVNVLSALDRDSEALAILNAALEANTTDVRLLSSKGQLLIELREYAKAKPVLKKAIKENPNDPKLHAALGQALSMLHKHEEALTELNQALAIQPGYGPALMFKGETLRAKGESLSAKGDTLLAKENNQEALQVLNQAVAFLLEDRERAWALGTKGQVLRALDLNDEAVESLKESVLLDESLAWAYGELIAALYDLSRLQETLDTLDRAVKLHKFSNWFGFQGQVLNEIAEFELAVKALDKAVALDSDSAQIYGAKGWALENLRDGENALVAYNRAEELEPKNLFWQIGVANCQYLKGEREQASAKYAGVLEEAKLRVDTTPHLETVGVTAWCEYRLNNFTEAIKLFTELLSITPDVIPHVFNLALVLICKESTDGALREYKRALRLADGKTPLARRGLIYVALDDLELAIESQSGLAERAEVKEAHFLLDKTLGELPRYKSAAA
ncbi:MAG TPA: tetratricopeptide repeat protein [Pyrinomonadaceae bacterium]|nr:tetratricopeptide repeat protein [Pyrinomonadaceae bacterium]